MINAHPYEEVAYDIYKLENVNKTLGIGRIGQLSEKMSVQLLCEEIKEKFEMKKLRVSGNVKKQVKKVAILGDRKSTRLNSSHVAISYAVFCLKKKTQNKDNNNK